MSRYKRRRVDARGRDLRDRWMVSYADFLTLLFAFFVVMYAVSSVDLLKLEKVSEGMRSAFDDDPRGSQPIRLDGPRPLGGAPTARLEGDESPEAALAATPQFAAARDRLAGTLGPLLREQDLEDAVQVRLGKRGFVISLAANSFFGGGSATLDERTIPVLDGIAAVLENVHSPIRVEGHTDDRPISTARFPSNWELSTQRATMVLRYLVDQYDIRPERISAAGYASYRPLVANDSEANRSANRRVDIVILTPGDAALEPGSEPEREALSHLLDQLPPLPED